VCVQLLKDPVLAQTCGRQARRIAETELSYSTLADALLEFYQKRIRRNVNQ